MTGLVRVHVCCKACRHSADADLAALIAAGNVPLVQLRYRRTSCRSRLTNFVVTGWATVKPW